MAAGHCFVARLLLHGIRMLRVLRQRRSAPIVSILLWLLHLTVLRVHAQEPTAGAGTPSTSPFQQTLRPRRFPRLLPPPPVPQPQARDSERPSTDESRARHTVRRHTGLLIGGLATLTSSYLVTALAAAMVARINSADCQAGNIIAPCDDADLMLIPVVGPFVADRGIGESLVLAGPQILGATLALVGVFQYASRPVRVRSQAFALFPVPLRDGGLLAARLLF